MQTELIYEFKIEDEAKTLMGLIKVKDREDQVGKVGFRYNKDSKEIFIGNVENMFYVEPNYRRRGIAKELGRKVLDLAKRNLQEKPEKINLTTSRENLAMQKVAVYLGFYIDKEDRENIYYSKENL